MANRQFSETSRLVNLASRAFQGITIPAHIVQHSWLEINRSYEIAILDLPRLLVQEVTVGIYSQQRPFWIAPLPNRAQMPNTTARTVGGEQICALLHDHLSFLILLIEEVRQLAGITRETLVHLTDNTQTLHPIAVHMFRAHLSTRCARTDFQRVAQDFERIMNIIFEVYEACINPAVALIHNNLFELENQLRGWHSTYLEILDEWASLF